MAEKDSWAEFREQPSVPGTVVSGSSDPWQEFREKSQIPKKEKLKYFDPDNMFPAASRDEGIGPRLMRGMFGAGTKGVPVIGQLTPENTSEIKQYEKDHPYLTGGAKIATGAAALAPLSIPSSHMGVWGNIAGQGLVGGGINVSDKIAEKGRNITGDELVSSGITGTAFGAGGHASTRLLAPFQHMPSDIIPKDNILSGRGMKDIIMNTAKNVGDRAKSSASIDKWHGRIDSAADVVDNQPILKYLLPALAAHSQTGSYTLDALAVGVGGMMPHFAKKWTANQINPSTIDILNSLSKSSGVSAN